MPGLRLPVRVLPMLHPAYLLRTPGAKKDAWADLLLLRKDVGCRRGGFQGTAVGAQSAVTNE